MLASVSIGLYRVFVKVPQGIRADIRAGGVPPPAP